MYKIQVYSVDSPWIDSAFFHGQYIKRGADAIVEGAKKVIPEFQYRAVEVPYDSSLLQSDPDGYKIQFRSRWLGPWVDSRTFRGTFCQTAAEAIVVGSASSPLTYRWIDKDGNSSETLDSLTHKLQFRMRNRFDINHRWHDSVIGHLNEKDAIARAKRENAKKLSVEYQAVPVTSAGEPAPEFFGRGLVELLKKEIPDYAKRKSSTSAPVEASETPVKSGASIRRVDDRFEVVSTRLQEVVGTIEYDKEDCRYFFKPHNDVDFGLKFLESITEQIRSLDRAAVTYTGSATTETAVEVEPEVIKGWTNLRRTVRK